MPNFPKRIRFFHRLSIALLLLSAALHFRAYLPNAAPLPKGVIFLLSIGLFITFIPAIRCASVMVGQRYRQDMWKVVLAPLSKWHRRALVLLIIYVAFNFISTLFVLNRGLSAEQRAGRYVLESKGRVVKAVDQATYVLFRNREFRGLSGHVVFFQAISGALLLAALRTQKRNVGSAGFSR
ncbi:MAG TPA: hypothetical protein VGE21_05425 [Flavobacteriales bacterium]